MTTSKQWAFLQEDYTKIKIKDKIHWVAQLVHLFPVPANPHILLKIREAIQNIFLLAI